MGDDTVIPGVDWPNVAVEPGDRILAPFESSKGLELGKAGSSSCSERTSEGPNDVEASGERIDGRDLREGDRLLVGDDIPEDEALTISAFTDPMT